MVVPFEIPIISPILLGRTPHLDALGRLLTQAQHGRGQVALLAGEAGIGKSRLVAALQAEADSPARHFTLVQGRCFEPDRVVPYAPLLDLLRTFIMTHSSQTIVDLLGSTAADLARLLPEIGDVVPTLVVATTGDSGPSEPSATQRALVQFVLRLARHGPLLVVVEDIHWSDAASLDLLLSLAQRITEYSILLLLTYRDDEVQSAQAGGLAQFLAALDRERIANELTLSRLTRDEVGTMVRAILDLSRLARAEFLDTVYAQTEGNPFFIEELLKSLITTGDINYTDGDSKSLETLRIPRSVQVAVQRRLDTLSQDAHELITLAAVAGRRFDFGILQALTHHDERRLIQLVKELMRAQLVVEESMDIFAFRHALTGQAVAAGLLGRERRALHRDIARALERLIGNNVDHSRLAELSHHYFDAQDWENVLVYAAHAGRQALRLYALQAAIDQFSRALQAARELPDTPSSVLAGLYHERAQAHGLLGTFESALADDEQALTIAREAGDHAAEWQTLLNLGYLWTARDAKRAGAYFQLALAIARNGGDPATLAHSLNRLGNLYVNSEQPRDGRIYHEEALALFQELDDRQGYAETFDLLAGAAYLAGDVPGAYLLYERAATQFREQDRRAGLVSALTWLCFCGATYLNMMLVAAPLSESIRVGEEALHLARTTGLRSGEAFASLALGQCYGAQGDYARALDAARAGLTIAQELGHTQWLAAAHFTLGGLYLDLLAPRIAAEHLEQALQFARQVHTLFPLRLQSALLALAYIRLDDLARAEALLVEAFGPANESGAADTWTMAQRLGWYVRAELALKRRNLDEALSIADRLIASLESTKEPTREWDVVPRLLTLRGAIVAELQRTGRQVENAADVLQHACAVATKYEARSLLWQIQVQLGRLHQVQAQRTQAIAAFAAAWQGVETLAATIPDLNVRDGYLRRARAMVPQPAATSPRRATQQVFDGLTEREREVADLVARGKSNREIAELLVMTERTTKAHVGHILGKLGFASRTQIVAWAIEKGLGNRPQEQS